MLCRLLLSVNEINNESSHMSRQCHVQDRVLVAVFHLFCYIVEDDVTYVTPGSLSLVGPRGVRYKLP